MEIKEDIKRNIDYAIEGIKIQYLANDKNIPWLIGYSGGKDSTCTAQLVFKAVVELKEEKKELNRQIYIFSSDTLIENPLVKDIVEKNISLINKTSKKLNLPIEAISIKPEIHKTFWVNVIGRGYPTPNTMFRWCTDRLKIDPANNFIHKCIDKNGEVIMVLGVREGESNTRDRVLKRHSIDGEVLMKHTTLTNAYIFPPIKHLSVIDVFTYLSAYESPWGSNNKDLFRFYEESGGNDCPTFLSSEEKKSSNSCGNSRMGCWVCTVVSKDKSLSGFIETGYYDFLKPLLEFRNWIVTIRDDDNYRCHFRNNGSIYTKKLNIKTKPDGTRFFAVPKKGDREKYEIFITSTGELIDTNGKKYEVVEEKNFSKYLKVNGYTFKSPEIANIILFDSITGDYSKLGVGPYTDEAKLLILERLLETEYNYNLLIDKKIQLISDEELIEIKKMWAKTSIDNNAIDNLLQKFNRKQINFYVDSFETISEKYNKELKKILKEKDLEFEVLNRLIIKEKELLIKEKRDDIFDEIEALFNADNRNY